MVRLFLTFMACWLVSFLVVFAVLHHVNSLSPAEVDPAEVAP